MAEFLVYCTKHWMDNLTQADIVVQVAKSPKHFMDKYNARYRWDDFAEVQEDGYWGDAPKHGWNKKIFALIKAPRTKLKDAQHYIDERYKEVTVEIDVPKLDYLEDIKVGFFKYDSTIIEEYTKPTEIPELGTIDVDWVKLSGIIDEMDKRRRYAIMTHLEPGQEIEITDITTMGIKDKVE